MDSSKAQITAKVTFLTTDEGGRSGPLPNKLFKCPCAIYGNNMNDCALYLEGLPQVYPGDTITVPMEFLCPEEAIPKLKQKADFALWEMGTIANGTVIEFRENS